jgi:dTDP-4-amino-4,6-dideoxygalactose transaminase
MTEGRRVQISEPAIDGDTLAAVGEVLDSGWLTQGPRVAELERLFAEQAGVGHAIAATSCTTAMHLALTAAGVGPGDEVLVPAFTWIATANVVLYCGARPVFADVDPATFNIDADQLRARVTPRTRAAIPVHLFGLCADMEAVRDALPAGTFILEDAACALGARLGRRAAGALGHAAAFSFHPRKIVTTGEGGMVTTDDPELAARVRALRSHGASLAEEQRHQGPRPHLLPQFNLLGFNYRMTDLQAAVGLPQLRRLGELLAFREHWAAWYRDRLGHLTWLRLPISPEGRRHAWQSFVTLVNEEQAPASRDRIMRRLQAAGVGVRPGTHAVHMLGLYRERFGLRPDDFPGARACAERSMAIPLHNRMTPEDFETVAAALEAL